MCIQTLKKKTGSTRKLSSYRGIFLVPVLSIIFEKLLKNRITPHLEENMTQFQTGGVKGKGVADNLFILRGMIENDIVPDHNCTEAVTIQIKLKCATLFAIMSWYRPPNHNTHDILNIE